MKQAPTKHVFVTGGVASSLGKGLTASSLGRLLRSRGLRVTMQKLDPYLNVDPGTMNPFQHGEVFVTDDGAETDLDIGHYERFLDSNLVGKANVTTGQIYNQVIAKEPLRLTQTEEVYDVDATLDGGGVSGQAGAIRLGIARALIALDPDTRPVLKKAGLLARDAREKERRKYGLKKARKAPQYSKR